MAPSSSPCGSLRRRRMEVEAEAGVEEMMSLIKDYQDGDLKKGDLYRKLRDMNQGTLAKGILILCDRLNDCECHCEDLHRRNIDLCDALRRKKEKMKCSFARLKCGMAHWKSCALNSCNSCNTMHANNVELNSSLAHLKSEIKMLHFNASLPCKSCDALLAENKLVRGENLEYANDVGTFLQENEDLNLSLTNLQSEIDLLKFNASMPCNSCVALNVELDGLGVRLLC
jgi:hypothetical protein